MLTSLETLYAFESFCTPLHLKFMFKDETSLNCSLIGMPLQSKSTHVHVFLITYFFHLSFFHVFFSVDGTFTCTRLLVLGNLDSHINTPMHKYFWVRNEIFFFYKISVCWTLLSWQEMKNLHPLPLIRCPWSSQDAFSSAATATSDEVRCRKHHTLLRCTGAKKFIIK